MPVPDLEFAKDVNRPVAAGRTFTKQTVTESSYPATAASSASAVNKPERLIT